MSTGDYKRKPNWYGDILVIGLIVALWWIALTLPAILVVLGGGLWLAFNGGYIWLGKAQHDIAATLVVSSALYAAAWICYGLRLYSIFKEVLQALASRSTRCTHRGVRNYGDIRALARFAGTPLQELARGRFEVTSMQQHPVSSDSRAATCEAGLLLVAFIRVYLIAWDQVERLTPTKDEAELIFTPGPLSPQRIKIPWDPQLTGHMPPRLRQPDAI